MKLDQLKNWLTDYREEISNLESYISTLNPEDALEVNLIAQRLNIPYQIAFLILSKAESLNLLSKGYQVFTKETDYPLGEYSNENDIPEELYNPYNNRNEDKEDVYIDLVFHPK